MKRILSRILILAFVAALAACGSTGYAASPEASVASVASAAPASAVSAEKESIPSFADGDKTNMDMHGNGTESASGQPEDSSGEPEKTETQILIAYFSRTGENYSVGNIEKGNTHIVADMIAEQTGGDTFEIRTVTPYPNAYDACTETARQELKENARPELAESLDNLDGYDVIFLGYPIWWGDMPMAVYTFLESYNFSGRTIVPFCTHEGSGLSSTETGIAAACPDAEVLEGLSIRGSVAQNSQEDAAEAVTAWLHQVGFAQ